MIKVLNIISNGLNREGITTTQLEYMQHLDMTNLQVDIAAVHDNDEDVIKNFEAIGCRVIRFPDRNREMLRYYSFLYRFIRAEKYQVVHVHGSSAILGLDLFVARLAGVKKRIVHSRNTSCRYVLVDKLLRPFFYHTYTMALACGREAGEFLFGKRPFKVFYNGKDFDKFRYQENIRIKVRDDLNLGNKLTLGFVGNLNEQKNPLFLIDILAEVVARYPVVHLLMIGDGSRNDEVRDYAKEKGVYEHITFMGRISNVHEVIQAADVMLLPSLYEGLPNVVLEWQIAGLPVLVSDKVTRECKTTNLVRFLPIDQGATVWVDQIMAVDFSGNRMDLSKDACELMKLKGFEIGESCKELKRIYSDL